MGIPLGEWNGADATDRLRETIVELHDATRRQTTWMLRLTLAMAVMTLVLVVLTVVLLVDPSF